VSTVLLGTAVFAAVIVTLVAALLLLQRVLLPGGSVRVRVRHEPQLDFDAPPGRTLLDTLTGQGLLVPSACGGQGTCGACKVRVLEGGGRPLATELSHVTRSEAVDGVRLACQMKVREDLVIDLPRDVIGAGRFPCVVESSRFVGTFIKELVLRLPEARPLHFRAGAYVQVECPPHDVDFSRFDVPERYRGSWERHGIFGLRSRTREPVVRAYSLANPPAESGVAVLVVRVATPPMGRERELPPGRCSSWLFSLESGDEVTLVGPFGDFHLKETEAEMIFIGGGSGLAPLRSMLLDLLETRGTARTISFWYGARSLKEAFQPLPEDRWAGSTGFIHQVVLDEYLGRHPCPEEAEYYLCGPPLMLDACLAMLDELGVEEDDVAYDAFGI
jgi:Na+-transporting NADH:ubiquinone oxidoreductase subunit F